MYNHAVRTLPTFPAEPVPRIPCELAGSERICGAPAHPCTADLIATIPTIEGGRIADAGSALADRLPSLLEPPTGYRFRTRCPTHSR